MIQPRPLLPTRDTCSRPTPYKTKKRVAGMAFNFSSVSLERTEPPSPGPIVAADSTRREASRGILRYRIPHDPYLSYQHFSSAS